MTQGYLGKVTTKANLLCREGHYRIILAFNVPKSLIVINKLFLGGGRVERGCWVSFQCRGVLLVWMIVGQGLIALAVGAGGGCLDIFPSSIFSLFLLPLFGRLPDID